MVCSCKKDLIKVPAAVLVLFSLFALISGLSFLVSYNRIESLMTYNRLFITLVACLSVTTMLSRHSRLVKEISIWLVFLLFLESAWAWFEFAGNLAKKSKLDDAIYYTRATFGNKNIFAASLVVQLPFAIYLAFTFKRARLILPVAALTLA